MNIIPYQFVPPRGLEEVKKIYGDFAFTELSGGNVLPLGSWAHDNLVVEHNICGTGLSIQLHKKVMPIFEVCLAEAIKRVPNYKIRILGGYCARHMQHNVKMPLSVHSWGAAFDVNWDKNPMGDTLITDLPLDWRLAFTEQGWNWGGSWKSPIDAMHWQLATGL